MTDNGWRTHITMYLARSATAFLPEAEPPKVTLVAYWGWPDKSDNTWIQMDSRQARELAKRIRACADEAERMFAEEQANGS